MHKILLFSCLLTFSLSAGANDLLPGDLPAKIKCQKQLQTQIKKVFGTKVPVWKKNADLNFDTQVFRSPAEVGEWYELRLTEKKAPQLHFYSLEKTAEFNWNKSCKMKEKKGPGFAFSNTPAVPGETFSDSDLKQLLEVKGKGLIYIWSPRMVYSVTEFARFRALAEKKKMEFIPILDHNADVAEAKAALEKAGAIKVRSASVDREPSSVNFYRKLNSVELYMRNANLHFPTMYIYNEGKLNPHRLTGVLTDEGFNQAADEWLGELK